jgi:uncharacterized protein YegP (UPF0339 family)
VIDFDDPPTMARDYRGAIEVYPIMMGVLNPTVEWRWRCRSKNNQIIGSGEGYTRKAGALNAVEAQYSANLTGNGLELDASTGALQLPTVMTLVVPWRLVIFNRDGQVAKIGALY